MSKQLDSQKSSPFDALKIAQLGKKRTDPAPSPALPEVRQSDSQTSKHLAKSNDPSFMKFTTYVRKHTHLAVKTRLVSQGREMSDLVENLLNQWLEKQGALSQPVASNSDV